MSGQRQAGSDVAPQGHRVSRASALFGVIAPPLAWFVQLTAGFAMASQPCFTGGVRIAGRTVPASGLLLVTLAALLVTIVAFLVAWRDWRRVRDEHDGGSEHMVEVGHGRTRFLALWGMNLGAGFTLVLLANLVALLGMPPCVP